MSRIQTLIFPPAPVKQEPERDNWLWWRVLAAIAALALLATGAALAQTPEAIQALQATAPGSEARKLAGQRACQETDGPLAVALWTADGHLVCRVITQEARK